MTRNRFRLDELETVLRAAIAVAPRAKRIHFTAEQIANMGVHVLGTGHSNDWWGQTLQSYRKYPVGREFTIACEGYGSKALWTLYVVPDHPTAGRLALSGDHALATATDAVRRMYQDLNTEVLPALRANGEPRQALRFRVAEFEVNGVNLLQAAGMARTYAMAEVIPLAADLRDRWAA
jgi:hypothetical protein